MNYATRLALTALGLTFVLQARDVSLLPKIPAGFEPRADAGGFIAKGLRYDASASAQGFRVALRGQGDGARSVTMSIVGGNPGAPARPSGRLPVKTSYFVGQRAGWRTGVPTYQRLRYEGVWPGIDVEYRSSGDQLEFDFILSQGADPKDVVLRYEGQDGLSLDDDGNLVITAGGARMVQEIPAIYQRTGESVHLVSGNYELDHSGIVRFRLGPYDQTRPLVIDPVIVYSGFVSGAGSTVASAFGKDAAGHWYVGGTTGAADLPVAGNAPQNAISGDLDVFVMRIDPTLPNGPTVTDLTYFGGSAADQLSAMVVDPAGVVYITGTTASTNLPVTDNAAELTLGGIVDAFMAKIDLSQLAAKALVYTSYLGGNDLDVATSMVEDASGNIYIAGYTASSNFPTAGTPFQATSGGGWDVFLSEYDTSGKLVYSTYIGGGGTDVARSLVLAPDGTLLIGGTTLSWSFPMRGDSYYPYYSGAGDAFVAKFSVADGIVYSTFLGGTGNDDLKQVAVNAAGQIVATGWTLSQDFPVTAGAYQMTQRGGADVFVTVIDPAQPASSALVYSSFFGGSDSEVPYGVKLDSAGQVLLTGYTYSSVDFPLTANAFQATSGGAVDSFIARIDPSQSGDASLVYSTYLGGKGRDIAYGIDLDASGNILVFGSTSSRQFPNVATADPRSGTPGTTDGFLLLLQP